jgi:hypothetical protein
MTLPVEQFMQLILQASKELSAPTLAAIVGVLLAQGLNIANETTFAAAGFLVGTLLTQLRNWYRSREWPYLAYLCLHDGQLTHTLIFERHKEQALFRQVQYCQICGNRLVKHCPKCEKAVTLRAKDEEVGRFCRHCGDRLFDEVHEAPRTPSSSGPKRRHKRPD